MFRILQSVLDAASSTQYVPSDASAARDHKLHWFKLVQFAVAVILAEAVAMELNAQSYKLAGVSLVWLPNGLIVATLLRSSIRRWPIYLSIGFLIDLIFNIGAGGNGPTSFAYACFNALEIVVASSLLYSHLHEVADLTEWRRLRAFLIYGVFVAPLSAATSASIFLYFHDGVAFANSVRFWYAADMLGIATVTPLCLSYYNGKRFSSRPRIETIFLFALFTSVVILVFGFSTFPSLWIVLLALILVGVRAGFTSSALGLLIVISIGGYLSIIGHGPLGASLRQSLANRTAFFQIFVAVSMVGLYVTEVVMTANRVARSELVASEARYRMLADQLEVRVQERTIELEKEIAEREIIQHHLINAKILAEESNRAKSIFLATMSHELRTPLNAILGYSDLLKDEASDRGDQSAITDLSRIHAAGHHLLAIITDVLDLSKIESGRIDLHLENRPVNYVLEDVEGIIAPLARRHDNVFSIVARNPDAVVAVDVVKFRQCLLNLLSNACKFTKKGQISLEVISEREDASITGTRWIVKDTGIGIDEKHLKDLFQPFSQVDSSETRRHEGTGLGLVISKRLVTMMNGHITLETKLGVGSSFTIHMPPAPLSIAGVDQEDVLDDCLQTGQLRPVVS